MTNHLLLQGEDPSHEFTSLEMEDNLLTYSASIGLGLQHAHFEAHDHYDSEEDASSWHRMLAGSDYTLFYGALSVAVLTLGMLLGVEAIRRKLDHSAVGRPFYQAVLDGVYRELATLGVVELFIHLLQEYSSGIDTNKKALFADIHFMLFYTALFNAFESVFLALITRYISTNMWVKTEELELSHYVEIRIEYEAVHEELYGCAPTVNDSQHRHNQHQSKDGRAASVVDDGGNQLALIPELDPNAADGTSNSSIQSVCQSIRAFCLGLLYTVRYPRLKSRYNNLLVQVRFHELRVHFLQAYELPLKLKVSDYLMNSETHVLTHLVHVSTSAWLWLTGLVNVLYFITGMIADATGTSESTATSLSITFFLGMVLFVATSVVVFYQMKNIFLKIMDMKHLWDIYQPAGEEGEHGVSNRFHDPDLESEQLGLFWLRDPTLVVTLIQFIQFGYAIALSVVVVFWDKMDNTKYFEAKHYLIAVVVSYALFVTVMSRVIPRYTMCTSLGQLVDRKRLHETVAMYRLEEAERRMRQQMENAKIDFYAKLKENLPDADHKKAHDNGTSHTGTWKLPEETLHEDPTDAASIPKLPPKGEESIECQPATIDDLVLPPPLIEKPASVQLPVPSIPEKTPPSIREIPEERASILADLVKMDTKSLRTAVPLEKPKEHAAELRDRRKNRRKSVSDGVALMAALGKSAALPFGMSNFANDAAGTPEHPPSLGVDEVSSSPKEKPTEEPGGGPMKFAVDDSALLKRKERRRNRKKAVSASAAIQEMRVFHESTDVENPKPPGTVTAEPELAAKTDGKDKKGPLGLPLFQKVFFASVDDSSAAVKDRKARRRESRKKSLSASAAVRLMRDLEDGDDQQATDEFWRNPDNGNVLGAIHEICSDPQPQPPVTPQQHGMFLSEETPQRPRGSKAYNKTSLMEVVHEAPGLLEDPSERFMSIPTTQSADDSDSPNKNEILTNGGHGTTLFGSKSFQDDDSGVLMSRDDDDETVDTAGSVGGLSDVDELSDANRLYYRHHKDESSVNGGRYCMSLLSRFNASMRAFFLGKTYFFLTHMVGTMLCFFLVGMRVEDFLHEQCIIPHEDFSWEMDLRYTFWCLVAFQALFISVSLWKVFLFCPCRYTRENNVGSPEDRCSVFVGAVIDIGICGLCLLLLMVAEMKRCCAGDDTDAYELAYDSSHHEYEGFRFLAGETGDAYGDGYTECIDRTLLCTCPAFGTRLEGGIGSIEPFTALIGLRMFRFLVARRIVNQLNLCKDVDIDAQDDSESAQHMAENKSHVGGATTTVHGRRREHIELKRGTAVELWQAAIAKHPAIVQAHGEFSGELLRAMLGVYVRDQPPRPTSPSSHAEKSTQHTFEAQSSLFTESKGPGLHRRNSSCLSLAGKDTITLDDKHYCKLAPEVQNIIASGRMGMPMKSCMDLSAAVDNASSFGGASPVSVEDKKPSQARLEFQVDVAQMELDQLDMLSPFEFPNARLIRSMRRCDRKLLPLLNKWTPVDVVITNHELVYIDASESGCDFDGDPALQDVGRQALIATKGGKGLRLCDVTAGRRVVGQLRFTDITAVHVERECSVSGVHAAESTDKPKEACHVELWQDLSNVNSGDNNRQERWRRVNEDRLKIQTIHGTLFLRFYSDLEDIEAHQERILEEQNEDNPLFKDIALQWAQTIVRQCHLEQLKQPFLHFGTDNELRDYLQIITRDEKQKGFRRTASRGHRRLASRGDHRRTKTPFSFRNVMADINNSPGRPGSPPRGDDDSVSDDPNSEGVPPSMPQRRRLSRLSSLNEGSERPSVASEKGARALTIG